MNMKLKSLRNEGHVSRLEGQSDAALGAAMIFAQACSSGHGSSSTEV
jgi:hypothetical protein